MKRVIILGSTGSIGESAVRVVEALTPQLKVVALAARRNVGRILEQARALDVKHVAISDPVAAARCKADAPPGVNVYTGAGGLEEVAALESDVVLCAVDGMAGLRPTLAALRNGTDVALATKEVLVSAGAAVTDLARQYGARLIPVDSEHSAIFQCLGRRGADRIARILLTASGGPFESRPEMDLDQVSVEQALNHPSWNMGKKVSVDSATLMNKGLEIMEARWLFGVAMDKIEVLVHPESIVHSLVEFVDGSVMAQLSVPDMRFAIQYALTYPDRCGGGLPELDLAKIGGLHFRKPDHDRFPCLGLALRAGREGGTMPAVLNAANEVSVHRFLEGEIAFSGIWKTVAEVMNRHQCVHEPSLEQVIEADAWAREIAHA